MEDDHDPVFSADGRRLLFLSSRHEVPFVSDRDREGTIASLKSDGLYSLDLPQGFQAEPQRVGPTLFGTISYGRKAAVDEQLHWNGLMRTT